MASKARFPLYLILAFFIILAVGAIFLWPHFMGDPPQIVLDKTPTHLGAQTSLSFKIKDMGMGLKKVQVFLQQGQKLAALLDQKITDAAADGKLHPFKLQVEPLKQGLGQGPASLLITARDDSLGSWFKGKEARLELPLTIDTKPPRITSMSRVIHLNRGGAGLAVYQISKDSVEHGVRVGKRVFKGYSPWEDKPELGLCYFAFSQDEEKTAPIGAWARDAAGNQASASLNVRLHWKKFRSDDINLSDATINALAQRFTSQAPPDRREPLQVFLWENEDLRVLNHNKIVEVTSQASKQQLWQGAFSRPRGKPMARFADRRTYFYNKKEISKAVHLGMDLADVIKSPILAVARAKVLFAAPLGIYGNCVILDHGQGVASLYGHLSRLDVKPGQEVKQDEQLGLSGATGLALGDHLHFSMLVGGVFVRPAEWWDPHWIKDNVDIRFEEAGVKAPLKP